MGVARVSAARHGNNRNQGGGRLKDRLERLARTIFDRYRAKIAVRPPWKRVFDVFMLAAFAFLLVFSIAGIASAWLPRLETWGNLQGYLAVGAGLVVLAALVARSHGWAVLAVGILGVNVATVGVRVAPVETCPVMMAATGEQTVRLLTHNLYWRNENYGAITRLLTEQDPDVVVLQEIQPWHEPFLERLKARYPYQAKCDTGNHCGVVVLSRYPVDFRGAIADENGHDVAMATSLSIDGRELVVVGAHLWQPFRGTHQTSQFDALTQAVAALPPNTVVAGDFNSVPWSPNMARFATGAELCVSNSLTSTWPQWLGPFGIPIDQVFLKPGVTLLSIAAVDGAASDHKALIATVGLR